MFARLALSATVALGCVLGCGENGLGAPTQPTGTLLADVSPPRPWSESYQSSGTLAPGTRCPAPLLLESDAGDGTATHTGRYTIVNSHCLNPSTGELTDGSFLKTTANGDQLSGTYFGQATVVQPPAPVGIFAVNGSLTFTGGTGRFANASGTVTMTGRQTADFSLQPVVTETSLRMEGTISY